MKYQELACSSMSLHEVQWAYMQLLSLSEQLTGISQCLFTIKSCLTHKLSIFPMQPRKNSLLRIKFHPSKHSEMPLEQSGDDNRTQAQLYDS